MIGHASKVSIISSNDYKPFVLTKDTDKTYNGICYFVINIDDSDSKPKEVPRSIVTDRIFEKLKIKDDQLNTEKTSKGLYLGVRKKKKKTTKNLKLEESKMDLEDNDYISFDGDRSSVMKAEESDEELITEEMFQKALQATLEQGIYNKSYFYRNEEKES